MKHRWPFFAFALAFTLCCSADTRIKTRMNFGAGGAESTVLVKGARMRTEMNFGPATIVNIDQCDAGRTIQVNDRAKTYMVTSETVDVAGSSSSKPASGQARGTIVVTMNAQDTGERKQFFGYTARHIKSQMSTDLSQSTCGEKVNAKFSTDGWYIDLPGMQACHTAEKAGVRQRAAQSGCQDSVVLKQNGSARLGYPVLLETTFETERGPFTLKQEATEVSNASLDAALFDVPAGYREVKTSQELMGFGGYAGAGAAGGANQADLQARIDAAKRAAAQAQNGQSDGGGASDAPTASAAAPAKRPGLLRIGVLKVTGDTSNVQMDLQSQLVNELHSLGADAVKLGSDPDDTDAIRKECADLQCDYVMNTAITEYSQTAGKKLGGLLSGGLSSLGKKAPSGSYEVKNAVRVYDPAHPEAQSITGENDYKDSSPEATYGGLLKAQARQALMQVRKLRAQ